MFEYMGDRLTNAIKNIKGMGKITESNINDAIREIRMALLEADVNYTVVKEFINNVKEKALGTEVMNSVKPDELFIKIVKDELVELLGTEASTLVLDSNPTKLILVGLQGSGKTTTAGKLANYLRKRQSKKPLLVALDVYRPAAIDQLITIGKQLNIEVFSKDTKDVLEIAKEALEYAKENKFDYIIFDGVPINGLPDSLIVAGLVDRVVLVTSIGYTSIDELNEAKKALEKIDAPIAGVVVNKVNPTKRGKYSNYYE